MEQNKPSTTEQKISNGPDSAIFFTALIEGGLVSFVIGGNTNPKRMHCLLTGLDAESELRLTWNFRGQLDGSRRPVHGFYSIDTHTGWLVED